MYSQIKRVVGFCLVAFLAFGSVNLAMAQGRGVPQTPAEQKAVFDANFVTLTTTLALTEEQGPKVKEILWTAQEKRTKMMAELRGSGGGGGGAAGGMRAKMEEMNKETLTALADVLTAEQLTKYSEVQAAQQQRRGGGQGRPPGQGR